MFESKKKKSQILIAHQKEGIDPKKILGRQKIINPPALE
jgi:hypothetical protein